MEEREKLDKEEARILDLLAQGLSRELRNPQRVGCPDSAVLRGIALRELWLADVQQWLDHLSACSLCFQEFTELERAGDKPAAQHIGSLVAVAAVLVPSWQMAVAETKEC